MQDVKDLTATTAIAGKMRLRSLGPEEPPVWSTNVNTRGGLVLPEEMADHAGGFISYELETRLRHGLAHQRPAQIFLVLTQRYMAAKDRASVKARRRLYIGRVLGMFGVGFGELERMSLRDRTVEIKPSPLKVGVPEYWVDLTSLIEKAVPQLSPLRLCRGPAADTPGEDEGEPAVPASTGIVDQDGMPREYFLLPTVGHLAVTRVPLKADLHRGSVLLLETGNGVCLQPNPRMKKLRWPATKRTGAFDAVTFFVERDSGVVDEV